MLVKTPIAGIFIPTTNRIDFVIRQLRYYASVGCQHTIYIGDSSPKEESEKIEHEIKKLGSFINARYYYLPGYNDWQAHYYLIKEVREKYICYSGDDDYQIPNSITKCIEFLETYPDYTSASGHAVSFRLKQGGSIYGQLERLADYPRQQIEDETGTERIRHFFNNYYVTHFSVNKTADLVNYWRNDLNMQDRSLRSEILPTALPLVHGKSKILDCLGFVRQIHNHHYNLPDVMDWVMGNDWRPSFISFVKILTEGIASVDNIRTDEARQIAKEVSWKYLARRLSRGYAYQYDELIATGPIKNKAAPYFKSVKLKIGQKLPWLKNLYRQRIRPLTKALSQIHDDVLRKGSKYYDDFKPVRESFTGVYKSV